jgi:hypothetical protein
MLDADITDTNLVGNVNSAETMTPVMMKSFLDELEALMNKYHIVRVDMCWQKQWDRPIGEDTNG